jgi:hypothetical protein
MRLFPGVEEGYTHLPEVTDIARDNRQTMLKRGRGNHSVALRTRVGNVQGGATKSHTFVEGQDAAGEGREYVMS